MFNFSDTFIAAIREGHDDSAFEIVGHEGFNISEAYMVTQYDPELADIHAWIVANLIEAEEDEMPMASTPRTKRVFTEEEQAPVTLGDILAASLNARR